MDNEQAVHQQTLITDTIVVTAKNTNFVYECQQYPDRCKVDREFDLPDYLAIGISFIIAVIIVRKLQQRG